MVKITFKLSKYDEVLTQDMFLHEDSTSGPVLEDIRLIIQSYNKDYEVSIDYVELVNNVSNIKEIVDKRPHPLYIKYSSGGCY